MITNLSTTERAALVLHLGLDGRPARDWDEIGEALAITRERARQITGGAIAKLRNGLADAYPHLWRTAPANGGGHGD